MSDDALQKAFAAVSEASDDSKQLELMRTIITTQVIAQAMQPQQPALPARQEFDSKKWLTIGTLGVAGGLVASLFAVAVAIGWAGGYAVLCAVKSFAPCRKCRGLGQVERFGKPRTCPRCHGRRLRLRLGRRAHNYWRRTHQAGTR